MMSYDGRVHDAIRQLESVTKLLSPFGKFNDKYAVKLLNLKTIADELRDIAEKLERAK